MYELAQYFDGEGADFLTTVVIAPLIEEFFKGLGILLLFLIALRTRKSLRGPLSGLVYGGVIGLGFSLTEDISYMVGAANEEGVIAFIRTFIFRVIMLGLSHTTYSAVTGLGFGFAVYSGKKINRIFYILAGVTGAIFLHFLRNFLVTTLEGYGFILAVILNLIVVLIFFALILFFGLKERKAVMQGLGGVIGKLLTKGEYEKITDKKNLIPFYNYFSLKRLSGYYNLMLQKQLLLMRLGLIRHRKRFEKIVDDASCHIVDTTYLELQNKIMKLNLDGVKLVSESVLAPDERLADSSRTIESVKKTFQPLILKSIETNKSITIQINSTIGRSICKIFGDESKYMVENQYRLNRDITGWLIIPNNETTNMTLLNAESINEQCTLRNGDVISIGNIKKGINKLPLVVCLNDI